MCVCVSVFVWVTVLERVGLAIWAGSCFGLACHQVRRLVELAVEVGYPYVLFDSSVHVS